MGSDLSKKLCPSELSVCPLSTSHPNTLDELLSNGFECVDFQTDLESCGGCGILEPSHNCMEIPGVQSVSCVIGGCQVNTCESGWVVSAAGNSCERLD
ncbi:uncharacterized protein STEHIDRAFT_46142 [Stereum hirsutum FP-91666 SS1]|uniref:uncharacterized protein n=1 Tax=Stereum hirsutum (strain FP-91666) TaxID=721885 RepID=UPI000440A5A9|nr:uncharacterized protein STEHIDRAFT_46142 [Stereum hirsutum FP-91666 SS1]EIM92630.1 hypothetical protein STEHIDRAFT_46142 [Stereum hirsutum FP-91666 SS1]